MTSTRTPLSLSLLLLLSSLSALLTTAAAYSGASSFVRRNAARALLPTAVKQQSRRAPWTMYDSSRDPPASDPNAWMAVAQTEKWISSTLAAAAASSPEGNPYTRKEVTYRCEPSSESALILANLFRRLKEARLAGEEHGQQQQQDDSMDEDQPKTFRQTQVIVIPAGSNPVFQDFCLFDKLMETINQARRNARDLVTDAALEDLDDDEEDDDETWSVSVSCAHLHPDYGRKTPQQVLQEMKQEEEDGEVDVHLEEYKKKRLAARQSPYPTMVVEVRAQPPVPFSTPPLTRASAAAASEGVSAADVARLEALFGQSAALHHPTSSSTTTQKSRGDEDFYAAIGKKTTLQEVSSLTPMTMAQEWIAAHDQNVMNGAAFTESSVVHADEAYEFVFTNLAMMAAASATATQSAKQRQRQYLVLPRFLSSAATSLEKFAAQVTEMMQLFPEFAQVSLETFHPEHVDKQRRSPGPMLVFDWKSSGETEQSESE